MKAYKLLIAAAVLLAIGGYLSGLSLIIGNHHKSNEVAGNEAVVSLEVNVLSEYGLGTVISVDEARQDGMVIVLCQAGDKRLPAVSNDVSTGDTIILTAYQVKVNRSPTREFGGVYTMYVATKVDPEGDEKNE